MFYIIGCQFCFSTAFGQLKQRVMELLLESTRTEFLKIHSTFLLTLELVGFVETDQMSLSRSSYFLFFVSWFINLRVQCIIDSILIYFIGPPPKLFKKAMRIFFIVLHNNIMS